MSLVTVNAQIEIVIMSAKVNNALGTVHCHNIIWPVCILAKKPWGGGWASITGGLVGQRTAPPLLLLLLSFNNCFSMSNFVLATKRYLI